MTKSRTRTTNQYRCTECGWTTAKWVGRCGECQSWGTVEERIGGGSAAVKTTAATSVENPAKPIGAVDATEAASFTSGNSEVDRVLGGGLVPGSVILLAGEPGIGKSTLLIDLAASVARENKNVLYISGEESAAQVKSRAARVNALADNLFLASEHDLSVVLAHMNQQKPALLVVDSVQTISSPEVDGVAGGTSQIREVAAAIISAAKAANIATVLVGHVTKDGSIAGPRLLEHLVDVVCQFEGERHGRLRLLRAVKNRFGTTDELGCFEMAEEGITAMPDPSALFRSTGSQNVSGTCLTVALEGQRPLVAEVQALLAESATPQPRRAVSGLDNSRVSMLLAVLQRRANLPLYKDDVYVSTVGGVRLSEPATDLAVALAIASSKTGHTLPNGLITFGEVGLAGEVRPVPGAGRRIQEAARLGFTHAVVPAGQEIKLAAGSNIKLAYVDTLTQALELVFARASKT